MPHLVLLGDSVFDNARYVSKGYSVLEQLRTQLSSDWQVTLLAVDGDVSADISRQLKDLPVDSTHLLISCGGNDALRHAYLLREQVNNVGDAMGLFAQARRKFQRDYDSMLSNVLTLNRRAAVCTVYDTIPEIGESALTALSMFNEIILRSAIATKIPVLDLRLVLSEKSDYSAVSPIEPSATGTAKLVRSISDLVNNHDFAAKQTIIYV
ncbi:MAG TPA: SGNH/GDSL hydrolase family protein [Candidatus Binatia bacterium]|nr:SGNH/GDSL hydrolase family protein [Candidatus Binatia bacterium]